MDQARAYDRIGSKYLLRGGFHRQVDVVRMGAIRYEQRIDIPAEIRVVLASAIEKMMLFGGRQVGSRVKYLLNLFPIIGMAGYRGTPAPKGNA
jgi:hypothetical protein